jgi:hypothetical protein
MSYRDEVSVILHRQITSFLDSRYEQSYKDHCKKVFEQESHTGMSGKSIKKISEYITKLLIDLSKEVYSENRDEVHIKIFNEVDKLVQDLFTEEESKEFAAFVKTQVGMKILRNMDLVRESYVDGLNNLVAATVKAWNRPDITEAIQNYVELVESEEKEEDEQ